MMCSQSSTESTRVTESAIGLRAYARMRGCSLGAVQRARRSGRLRASVILDDRGQPKILPALADEEWSRSTLADREPVAARAARERRGSQVKTPTAATAFQQAQTELYQLRAQRERVDMEVRCGRLIDAAEAERGWTHAVVVMRTALLAIPGKLKAQHPTAPRVLLVSLDAEIRRALELLADGGGAGVA